MGLKEPERPDDEFVQFSEPSRGIYQTVIIREGHPGRRCLQVDPAEGYYVPCIPLDKPQLMAEIRARGLRSPSAVFAALATGGVEHGGSKMVPGVAADDDVR